MTREQHYKRMLHYVNLMTLRDSKMLAAAVHQCWYEQLNGNAGSQASADALVREVVGDIISKASADDLKGAE